MKTIKIPEMTEAEIKQLKKKWEDKYVLHRFVEMTDFNLKFYLVIGTVITILVAARALKYFP